MKKLFSILSLFVLGLFLLGQNNEVNAAVTTDVNVNITAIFDETNPNVELKSGSYMYGATINTPATLPEVLIDKIFAFWIVDGVIDLNRPDFATTFVATTDLEAVAVFHAAEETVNVYLDFNGRLISAHYGEHTPPTKPTKVGAVDDQNWDVLSKGNVTINRAVYIIVSEPELIDITVGSDEPVSYEFNEIVTLTLPAEFTHWEEDGKVISYSDIYKFTALTDRTLIPGKDGVKENLVTFKQIDHRVDHNSYLVQLELLDGYELVEYGLVSDNVLRKASNLVPDTNEFLISTPSDLTFDGAYMIVKDSKDEYFEVRNHNQGALKNYTVNITLDVPENTPDTIYILGNFNNWQFTETITKDQDGNYATTLNLDGFHDGNKLELKLTAGLGWGTQATYVGENEDNQEQELAADININWNITILSWRNIPDPAIPADHVRVYVENQISWFEPRIHYWYSGGSENPAGTEWPGYEMIKSINGYYYFDIANGSEGSEIWFKINNKNNENDQTADTPYDEVNRFYYLYQDNGYKLSSVTFPGDYEGVEVREN